jgi:hypothetical protein
MKGRDLWEFVLLQARTKRPGGPTRPSPFYQQLKIPENRPSDQILDSPADAESVIRNKIRIHGNIQAHLHWFKSFIEQTKATLYIVNELVVWMLAGI